MQLASRIVGLMNFLTNSSSKGILLGHSLLLRDTGRQTGRQAGRPANPSNDHR